MNDRLRSTVLHLRFPFSFFLLPIFLAALAAFPFDPSRAFVVFVVFHLLVYPASNGFNSYFDKDEGPIGGLAVPPPVFRSLLVVSLILDGAALILAFAGGPLFGTAVLGYGTGSKLYSWDRVRLKRLPWVGWLWTGLGQGMLTFIAMAAVASGKGLGELGIGVYAGSALIALFLLGVYPLTQIYQHDEDARRGDLTISRLLGIRGTFMLSAVCLGAATAGFFAWIASLGGGFWAVLFLGMQLPAFGYFLRWAAAAFRDERKADYRSMMWMNIVASSFMSLFFALFLIFR
ncbi:MAG: UbiA family prenyltransferase [Treponemataceae bacterium]